MADCVFCKIVKGEVAAQTVYEGEKAIAILDINPVTWGHTLVLPRDHHETWTDLPSELAVELARIAQIVARGVVKAAGAEGFNLLMNNHKCSGQAIAHAHFHVIPRKSNDGVRYNWVVKPYAEGDLPKAADAVRAALKA